MNTNKLDILKLRKLAGLTQTEMAKKLGLNLRTIQNYEKGTEIPISIQKLIQYEFVSYLGNEIKPYSIQKNDDLTLNESKTSYQMKNEELTNALIESLNKRIEEQEKTIAILSSLVTPNSQPKKKEAG